MQTTIGEVPAAIEGRLFVVVIYCVYFYFVYFIYLFFIVFISYSLGDAYICF